MSAFYQRKASRALGTSLVSSLSGNPAGRFQDSMEDQRWLNHAYEQGYLTFQNRERSLAAKWKRVCRSRRKPYLHVRQSRTNAVLFLDMEPAGERLMPDTKSLLEAVCDLVAAQDIRCGRSFLYCHQVPLASAHKLARLILRLVHFQEANAGRHANVA